MDRSAMDLPNEFAYATECSLATLSQLRLRKSTSKSDIRRQTNICVRMLSVCQRHCKEIAWGDMWRCSFSRVKKILDAVQGETGVEQALKLHLESL